MLFCRLVFVIFLAGCSLQEDIKSSDIEGGQSNMPPYGLYCFCKRDVKNMELLVCKDAVSIAETKNRQFYESMCR